MGITNVTETQKVPAVPAPPAAPAPKQEPKTSGPAKEQEAAAPPPPVKSPPPPPPAEGYDIEVVTGEHAGTGRRVYGFVEPDSGELLVQIPIDSVLNMVAQIVAKLEAEGRA